MQIRVGSSVKYDLIGKLVGDRFDTKAVVAILTGIERLSLSNSSSIRKNLSSKQQL